MNIDETKSAELNVYALINQANSLNLTPATGINLGTPTAFAGPDGHNTKMTLTGDQNKDYDGTVDIFYTRLGLEDNVANPDLGFRLDKTIYDYQFRASIVSRLKLVDSELAAWTRPPTDQPTLQLSPIANSLLYAGVLSINVLWPQYYTYMLDTFTADGALASHVLDSGGNWTAADGINPVASGQLLGGYLRVLPGDPAVVMRAPIVVPSRHALDLRYNFNRAVVAGDTTVLFTIKFTGPTVVYTAEFWADGSVKITESYRTVTVTNSSTSYNVWTPGEHSMWFYVEDGAWAFYHDDRQLPATASYDMAKPGVLTIELTNNAASDVLQVNSIRIRTAEEMTTPPVKDLWSVPMSVLSRNTDYVLTVEDDYWTDTSPDVIGEYLWSCENGVIRGFSGIDGYEVTPTRDINTYLGVTGADYSIIAVKNNVNGISDLWLASNKPYTAGHSPILKFRCDQSSFSNRYVYGDLFKTEAATDEYRCFAPLGYKLTAQHVWCNRIVPGSGLNQVALIDFLGNRKGDQTIVEAGYDLNCMYYDPIRARLWVSESGTSGSRVRVFNTTSIAGNYAVAPKIAGAGTGGWGALTLVKTLNNFQFGPGSVVGLNTGLVAMPNGGDVMTLYDWNTATSQPRLTYFSGSDLTQLLTVDIPDPRVAPITNWAQNIYSALRYAPVRNELLLKVQYEDQGTTLKEIWAFKPNNLTYKRKVVTGGANRDVGNWTLDMVGNVFSEMRQTDGTSKLVRSFLN
jgi:hypothetical protein